MVIWMFHLQSICPNVLFVLKELGCLGFPYGYSNAVYILRVLCLMYIENILLWTVSCLQSAISPRFSLADIDGYAEFQPSSTEV